MEKAEAKALVTKFTEGEIDFADLSNSIKCQACFNAIFDEVLEQEGAAAKTTVLLANDWPDEYQAYAEENGLIDEDEDEEEDWAINISDLGPKQKANLDAFLEMLPDLLSGDALKDAKPTQFAHIIFDIESDTPDEIGCATKVCDEEDSDGFPGALLLKTIPSVGDSPTIQLFAMDIRA